LTGASGSGLPSSNSYDYDSNGNRTSTDGTSESTGTNNQLSSDGTYDYTYDADGNLITQTTIATGATENFTWDYRNRLTEITYKNSSGTTTETIQYTYNASNQRISQTVKNGSGDVTLAEDYVYDPNGNLIMITTPSGTITDRYLFGPETNQALADTTSSGNTSWMLADQAGTIRDVVNSGGSVTDHVVYDPYGNIVSQTNSANQPRFGFDGMQLDSATGLYYDRARFYDAGVGRFISQDPTEFDAGDANLFRFVSNDPINFVDPTGLAGADIRFIRYISNKYNLSDDGQERLHDDIEDAKMGGDDLSSEDIEQIAQDIASDGGKYVNAPPEAAGGFIDTEFLTATASATALFTGAYLAIQGTADAVDTNTMMTEEYERAMNQFRRPLPQQLHPAYVTPPSKGTVISDASAGATV
jgi:RHS repeat-associated protein